MDEMTLDLLKNVYRQSESDDHIKNRILDIMRALGKDSLLDSLRVAMDFEENAIERMEIESSVR